MGLARAAVLLYLVGDSLIPPLSSVAVVQSGDPVQISAKQFSDLGNRCVQRLKLRDGELMRPDRGRSALSFCSTGGPVLMLPLVSIMALTSMLTSTSTSM